MTREIRGSQPARTAGSGGGAGTAGGADEAGGAGGAGGAGRPAADILHLDELVVTFPGRGLFARRRSAVQAVRAASLTVPAGQAVALVGESGCGKSTLGRAAVRLVKPTGGRVLFGGRDITDTPARALRPLRPRFQMVFQDPYSSLDPSMTVVDSVGEPLRVHERLSSSQRAERVLTALQLVGLEARHLYRYPYEFSGGQRQRLALARALVLDPDLLVCDEVTSALDVSTQNQILALLRGLQQERHMALLFISHNLLAVRSLADRVAVMYLGKVVEEGPTERIFHRPAHPYTQALLAAIPGEQRRRGRSGRRVVPTGELPSPVNPPPGCPFHTRCPVAMDRCRTEMPARTPLGVAGSVACHNPLFPPEEGAPVQAQA